MPRPKALLDRSGIEVQNKTKGRVDTHLVNTPVTTAASYFEIFMNGGILGYVAEYKQSIKEKP